MPANPHDDLIHELIWAMAEKSADEERLQDACIRYAVESLADRLRPLEGLPVRFLLAAEAHHGRWREGRIKVRVQVTADPNSLVRVHPSMTTRPLGLLNLEADGIIMFQVQCGPFGPILAFDLVRGVDLSVVNDYRLDLIVPIESVIGLARLCVVYYSPLGVHNPCREVIREPLIGSRDPQEEATGRQEDR